MKRYKTDRLAEKAGPKTNNDEVLLLLRLCGDQGDLIRAKLRRDAAAKALRHAPNQEPDQVVHAAAGDGCSA